MKYANSLSKWCLFGVVAGTLLLSCTERAGHTQKETPATGQAIEGKEIRYVVDGKDYLGYLAWDSTLHEKRPGILVVHEWWGYNAYARRRARMLAELGYTAFALDMYGEGKIANHPAQAAEFARQAMASADTSQAVFQKALDILKSQPTVDPQRIGAIGYCFGGAVVLQMARAGKDLDGVVTFHAAGLTTDHPATSAMKTRVLICTGEDDPMSPAKDVEAFAKEMIDAGVNYEIIGYPGAKHAFTNPAADSLGIKFGIPLAYNPAADTASWDAMKHFFTEIFH